MASLIRAERQAGKARTNSEKRQAEKEERRRCSGPLTVARLWKLYRDAPKGQASIRTDSYNFANHIEPYLARKEAGTITTADVDLVRRKAESKGLAPQTVKHVLGHIRRLMRYGQSLGLLVVPPSLIFHMPKVDNLKTECMTDE